MQNPLLLDVIIILALAVLVSWVFSRIRVPPVIGYLITGLIIGPSVLSLIDNQHQVEMMAEIGVIFLLFTIGMELSLKQFWSLRKSVFLGGGIQVFAAWVFVFLISITLDFSWNEAVFLGFLFSLSSTAIVLKILKSRDEIDSAHGRTVLSFLIFQDIVVVPMMLVVPLLSGESGDPGKELILFLIKATSLIIFTIVASRYLVPRLLFAIAKTGSDELFILTITVFCLGVAAGTNYLGLSFALGAFLAGLCISQ
ncbi:MAG: potassium transporter KefB, partial [Bacteroidia bacterium]|nr:potassium transporter KefB [Bacteroidia bacterium]